MSAFEEYLISKKIDPAKFKSDNQGLYNEFSTHFDQMHIDSFTAQKLFLINKIRRKYPSLVSEISAESKKTTKVKPIFKPRIKK